MIGAYAARAVKSLTAEQTPFDLPQLSRKAGIKRNQAALLAKLVRMAEQDGYLVASNGSFAWSKEKEIESPDAVWRNLFREFPRYQAELLLLAHAGGNLSAKLRGDETADTTAGLMDQMCDTSPFQSPYNQIARSAVEKLIGAWPVNRPMRVLDISGNGGGLAAWLLPVIPAERADYLFTDRPDHVVFVAANASAADDLLQSQMRPGWRSSCSTATPRPKCN